MTGRAAPARGVWLAVALAAVTVLLSAAPRLALAAGTLPEAARPFVWSDVLATYTAHLAGGRIPYRDTFFDYPPGIGYLAGLFSVVAPGPLAYVALWTLVAMAAAGIVALLLARSAGAPSALLYWSCSPQLLLFGALNFDVLPIAMLVGALLLARRERRLAALGLLALGAVTKAFPAAVAPLEAERLWRERGPRAALAGAAVFAGLAAAVLFPSLVAPWPSALSLLNAAGRTNVDSVFGLLLGALDAARIPEAGSIVVIVSLVGMVATYVLAVIPRARAVADPVHGGLLALLAILLWSRLYSPQFSLWLPPMYALLGLSVRRYALLSVADVVVFASVYPLTILPWAADNAVPQVLLGAVASGVILRHLALLLVWRDLTRATDRPGAPPRRGARRPRAA